MARPKLLAADEKKSARVSLLMTPQFLADVTTLAQIKQITLNELFCSLAAQAVKKNRQAIDDVQKVMASVASTVEISLFDDDTLNDAQKKDD